ncbi:MAG: DUF4292 domain-containing protein [Salegentibacter sp.]
MLKKTVGVVILCVVLVSCGASRKTKMATRDAGAAKVIRQHYKNEADFTTITAKLRATYQDEEKTQSVNLSFRMKKDSAIWMSATVLGFPVAKAYITPKRVSYYEKVSKTYFDGDFSLLSEWLGTPLDFQKLQNLLIGQSIYDLREDKYALSQSARGYELSPTSRASVKRTFLLDPATFKAIAQQLAQESQNRSVTVTYPDYQKVSNILFPKEIKIIANEGGKSTNIDLTYRAVEFNREVSFPFDIPSGYEEIGVK